MAIVYRDLIPAVINQRPIFPFSFQVGSGSEDTLLTAVIPVGSVASPALWPTTSNLSGGINQGDSLGSDYRIWKDVPAQMRPVELTVQNNFVDATLTLDLGIYEATAPGSGPPGVLNQSALATDLTFAAERTQKTPLIMVGPNPITNLGLSFREMIPQDLYQNPPTGQTSGAYDIALTLTVTPTGLPPYNQTIIPFNGAGPLGPNTPIPYTAPTTITGITNAADAVVTDTAHGYTTGQYIYIEGVAGMPQINGRFYIVEVVDANSYTLDNVDGTEVNSTTYGTYVSGGQATLTNNFILLTLEMMRIA